MFRKILIANRGEIAYRIINTLDKLNIESVAIYAQPDRFARHVRMATHAIALGGTTATETYLNIPRILAAAQSAGADAIHPGYGFLSENAEFAEACAANNIIFIGPTPAQLRLFGLKHTARQAAQAARVPLAPGSQLVDSIDHAIAEAQKIGFPIMLKGTAGGGGIGLQLCRNEASLRENFERTQRLAGRSFGNAGVFLESWIEHGRHIEVQIFGDGHGNVRALGERDCSAQRRHQKLLEETPPIGIAPDILHAMRQSAIRLGESVAYANAGTVEFIYDTQKHQYYFLEVNTRLQVEHCVTEQVTNIDLVEWMIRQSENNPSWQEIFLRTPITPQGAAIEVRIYAEDPARNFQPATGLITESIFPENIRLESWIEPGLEITPYFDPLLAKLIVTAPTRPEAVAKLQAALNNTRISGLETNVPYLRTLAQNPAFVAGTLTTRSLEKITFTAPTIEVIEPGTLTTIQDYPGRLGYWAVGIPPSGPMDARAFQNANRALGNAPGTAALEITLTGPTLRFAENTVFCLTGAEMAATLNGTPIPWHKPVTAPPGSLLAIGKLTGPGCRAYLAIQGGLQAPLYLGSRSTFTLGQFGGHNGRALRPGDILHIAPQNSAAFSLPQAGYQIHPSSTPTNLPLPLPPFAGEGRGPSRSDGKGEGSRRKENDVKNASPPPLREGIGWGMPGVTPAPLTNNWEIEVAQGPHAAPDFFTEAGLANFYATIWEVHYNSSRTGIRLIGPKPEWARADGGEAGLHPSNIHDTAYAIGAIDFTGDMPVILGPDGPSLGGFVCPATITQKDLWKIGQLRPNDTVKFIPRPGPAILHAIPATVTSPAIIYRRSGDANILVEYGPLVLDLELRFRIHVLMQTIQAQNPPGLIDITPGIRSLQLHFDTSITTQQAILQTLIEAEKNLPSLETLEVPSRIIHLPLSWDDPSTQRAIAKYTQSVRPDAPWCPSNIEFIRRINGLNSIEDVKKILFTASYLVLGLGDVYLGAPVATPLDPRHRLVTTKYNPARTHTPENAVGIGGAYLCIYGMEGPGGYQFVGRTCQVWNKFRTTPDFHPNHPWVLRFFDQIRFYEVSESELEEFRENFPHGLVKLRVEETTFSLAAYRQFLAENAAEITQAKARQQAAFEAERSRWAETPAQEFAEPPPESESSLTLAENQIAITSPVSGSLWRIEQPEGSSLTSGTPLFVIESMKTEIAIPAATNGILAKLLVAEGRPVRTGQTLAIITLGGTTP